MWMSLLQACQEICARSYREWRAEEEVNVGFVSMPPHLHLPEVQCSWQEFLFVFSLIRSLAAGRRRYHGGGRVLHQSLISLLAHGGHRVIKFVPREHLLSISQIMISVLRTFRF
jgi:hypothetical protein